MRWRAHVTLSNDDTFGTAPRRCAISAHTVAISRFVVTQAAAAIWSKIYQKIFSSRMLVTVPSIRMDRERQLYKFSSRSVKLSSVDMFFLTLCVGGEVRPPMIFRVDLGVAV